MVVRGEGVQSGKETEDFNYTGNTVFFTFLNRSEKNKERPFKIDYNNCLRKRWPRLGWGN